MSRLKCCKKCGTKEKIDNRIIGGQVLQYNKGYAILAT